MRDAGCTKNVAPARSIHRRGAPLVPYAQSPETQAPYERAGVPVEADARAQYTRSVLHCVA